MQAGNRHGRTARSGGREQEAGGPGRCGMSGQQADKIAVLVAAVAAILVAFGATVAAAVALWLGIE